MKGAFEPKINVIVKHALIRGMPLPDWAKLEITLVWKKMLQVPGKLVFQAFAVTRSEQVSGCLKTFPFPECSGKLSEREWKN